MDADQKLRLSTLLVQKRSLEAETSRIEKTLLQSGQTQAFVELSNFHDAGEEEVFLAASHAVAAENIPHLIKSYTYRVRQLFSFSE